MVKSFFLAFIPLFVAVDALGVLPIFISLTEDSDCRQRRQIIVQSMVTAVLLAVFFIFLGKSVFKFLGITISDFMIAGGILLFYLAVRDIMNPEKERRKPDGGPGAVPLGTPLIVGPAVLTTSLISVSAYGTVPTLAAVLVNVFFAGVIFLSSDLLIKGLGSTGIRAVSKVTNLLLAGIGVMLVRKGLEQIIR